MRLMKLLLSALLLTCFSIQTQADGPGNIGDIAVPSIAAPNMDVPAPRITPPNMDMPNPNPKPLVTPEKNLNSSLNNTGNTSTNQTQMSQLQQEAGPMDVSGKWLIKLNDGAGSSLDLNLWSSGATRVMGFGTLTDNGAVNSVTASGSVDAKKLALVAKSATSDYASQKNREYDLELSMVNNTLSGTYVMKLGGQFQSKGNATAMKQ